MGQAFRRRTALAARALVPLAILGACATAREPGAPPLAGGRLSRAQESAAEAEYRAGLAAVEAGDHEAAYRAFSTVVEEYPSSDVSGLSLYWRGRSEYQLGRDADAAASMRRYVDLAPDVAFRESAVLIHASALYGVRDYSGALDAARRVDRASPERLDDFLALSRDLLNQLPRPAVEVEAAAPPPRNYLAPFYLQAARWAVAAGDSARAAAMAGRVLQFPELPPTVLSEARAFGGPAAAAMGTRPVLGFLEPREARFAQVSEWIGRGIDMALVDVNERRSPPVEILRRSAAADPDSTAEVIRQLARGERVEAIIGPLISEYALPAARTATEEAVPLVSPTATDARLLEIDPRVFTVNALDGSIGHTLGTYAVRNLERTRFAVLAVDNAYGRIQADAFTRAVESAGGRVVIRRDYEPGAAQFTDYLGAIVRSGAHALFISTNSPNEALRVLNQMAFYELGGILPLGTDAWNDPDFFTQGRGFVRGYFADTFSRDERVTRWSAFAADYELRYGEPPPNRIPSWGYDAARLALERLSPAANQVGSEPYRGASGLFRFGPQGIRRAVVIHRIEAGRPVALEW